MTISLPKFFAGFPASLAGKFSRMQLRMFCRSINAEMDVFFSPSASPNAECFNHGSIGLVVLAISRSAPSVYNCCGVLTDHRDKILG